MKHGKDLRTGRYSEGNNYYFVTTNTHNREALFLDFDCARIVINNLKHTDKLNITNTIGFVLMPDHLHWLFQLNETADLSYAVGSTKGRSAKQINTHLKRNIKVWQPGFYDHCLRQDEEIKEVMRYIVANPLRANLVDNIGNYSHWDCIYLPVGADLAAID
ncbi:transposase [Shewanella eurypsychrophilus]|uniref:Transposase n=1 Tax=Shewanella eurypsychrophilus TaxID=2593656 RepID=A0ABX6V9F8_9GAMM|nr:MULTISPECIES: transposase [Shewanella]QFU23419.1 transposase [Shewanella sp. YLB-09]QPG58647.1 transposase [Shewanella eurypsychrophilus]